MIEITKLSRLLPSIKKPILKLSLNGKLKWTGLVLIVYLMLSSQLFGRVYGVMPGAAQQFQTLQMLLGSSFGTLMTLGIGPIVTASIILQLLVGSKIINWDMSDPDQRERYQATQKIFAVSLCFIEAAGYVIAGAVPPKSPTVFMTTIVILQLAMGGLIVLLLDEIISKYGIGSGISLFIAAGVTSRIFIGLFTPFTTLGGWPSANEPPAGVFWGFIYSLLASDVPNIVANLLPIVSTLVVFFMIVYAQSVTVDIPLSFAAVRGFGRRWSLNLFYTSNIPVILAASLLSMTTLWGTMMAKPTPDDPNLSCGLMGCFLRTSGNARTPVSGIAYYLSSPQGFIFNVITGTATRQLVLRAFTYLFFMVLICIMFSIFWVSTSSMDAESVANQITSIGMHIPGYRRDPRIIKQVLNKYIPALAVLGGASIGLLAALADFTGALGTGTGILLTVTIIYQFYQQLKSERLEEAHPLVRRIMEVS